MEDNTENLSVGNNIRVGNSSWTFSGDTAQSFTSHIRSSIPLYDVGHDLVVQLSDFFVGPNSHVYELGTSTGNLITKVANRQRSKPDAQFIGIDLEDRMIEQARQEHDMPKNVQLFVGDILSWKYEPCDLILAYYTVQFVPPRNRQILIDRIYQALNWGGAFILFEKVRAPDARFQDICSSVYIDFKLEQGFTSEEIINKARSLKGVLEPFSTQGNIDLLERAGFKDIMTVFKHIPFEGFLAIK